MNARDGVALAYASEDLRGDPEVLAAAATGTWIDVAHKDLMGWQLEQLVAELAA